MTPDPAKPAPAKPMTTATELDPAQVSPQTTDSTETTDTSEANRPRRVTRWLAPSQKPATAAAVCVTSSVLGALAGGGLVWAFNDTWNYFQLGLFVVFFGVFHIVEFLVTAVYNPRKLTMDSFVLTNGKEYVFAQTFAFVEAVVCHVLWPSLHTPRWYTWLGLVLVVAGQFLRTKAMIVAAVSFSHIVAYEKRDDHVLVDDSVYGFVRHPSYSGYYLWAVGTQLVLGNWLSTIIFSVVLFMFFRERIDDEETYLVRFFGDKYLAYRQKTWSGIPFVP